MDAPNQAAPSLSIGRIAISGVDGATAHALGPAITGALAALPGVGASRRIGSLHLQLKPGATAADIAAALASALARERG